MVKRAKNKFTREGANLVGAYCPSCGVMIFMQPGIKQCPSCKAFVGMDLWVETPPPAKPETMK